MTEPLISVIIPVYNAEKHIKCCVASICRQTYKNLEIIIVDDGSGDGSKAVLQQLEQKDSRIRVIYQKNRGPASARNTGVQLAKGAYLLFVDSDDWISRDHVEYLYQILTETGSDIASSSFFMSYSEKPFPVVSHPTVQIDTRSEALRELLYSKKLNHSPWGKLYRRELFENIAYPEGYLYEDLFTTWRLFQKANTVAVSDAVTYCYFIRSESIVHGTLEQRHLVGYDAIAEIKHALGTEFDLAVRNLYMIRSMEYMRQVRWKQKELLQEIWKHVEENRSDVWRDRNASPRIRLFALLSYTGRWITKKTIDLYYR